MNEKKFLYYGIPVAILASGLLIAGAIYLTLSNNSPAYQKTAKNGNVPNIFNNNIPSPNNALSSPESRKINESEKNILKITEGDHVRGNKNAKVVIIEYSDLQCPYCAEFHITMKQLLSNYPNDIAWVYRHFPISSIHPEAIAAAEASECIWEQEGDEGFWQFIDDVFRNQNRIGQNVYKELAQEIGVDMDKFNNCLKSGKYKNKIEAHFNQGKTLGINGTPSSFINESLIEGAYPYNVIENVVKYYLK